MPAFETSNSGPRWRFRLETAGLSAALILAVLWVYQPAVHGGWLWDDAQELGDNPAMRNGSGLVRLWLGQTGPDYFPMKSTVQWLQWHAWGGRVEGYHLTNIALHAIGSLLVWRIFRRLGIGMAWIGGLWFAVHPLAVESVAWISELKNTLSLPVLLVSVEAYLRSEQAGPGALAGSSRRWYLVSLIGFAAAMLCKSSVVMFPVVGLLHAWWRRGRVSWRDLARVAPFLAVSFALGLVTLWLQNHRVLRVAMGPLSRVSNAGLSLAFYLGKCLWPAGLIPVYSKWRIDPPPLEGYVAWLVLVALGMLIWRLSRSPGALRNAARHAGLGLGFFVLMAAPVLGFAPMAYQHFAWVADHLAYVPLIGIVGLAAGALSLAPRAFLRWGIGLSVAAAMAVASRREARIFAGPECFWSAVEERNPNAAVARINLGYLFLQQGRLDSALSQLESAVRLGPDQPEAHNNYASALAQSGRLPEAKNQAEEALRLKPDYPEAHNNLGLMLLQKGQIADSIVHFEAAMRLRPDFESAAANLRHARQLQAGAAH